MTSRTITSSIRKYIRTADQYQIKIPNELRANLTIAADSSETITPEINAPTLREAVYAAHKAGRDIVTDPDVTAAVIGEQVAQLTVYNDPLTEQARTDAVRYVRTHADAIIDAFKPVYNTHAQALTDAHSTLGTTLNGPNDPALLQARGRRGEAALAAREAAHTLDDLDLALKGLLAAANTQDTSRLGPVALTVDISEHSAHQTNPRMSHWDALNNGYTISLANLTEARARRESAYEVDETELAAQQRRTRERAQSAPRAN